LNSKVRERSGCSVVAVEHNGQIQLTIQEDFKLSEEDAFYICGSSSAVDRYYDQFPASRM